MLGIITTIAIFVAMISVIILAPGLIFATAVVTIKILAALVVIKALITLIKK